MSSELTIERGRLFVRSSIASLFILIVSFGFFFTYVIYVYRITEIGEELERLRTLTPSAVADLDRFLGESGDLVVQPEGG